MPAYVVEFATAEGPRRLRFTLDPERLLGPQVHQILEEMRQHGVLLSGGPSDELGVYWNGADLELGRSPEALGVTPDRPLELRMRPRPARALAAVPEPPITAYFPRSTYAAPLAGAAGGLLGWLAASMLTDLGPWLPSYCTLDFAAAALLGAGIGLGVRASAAVRKGARVWLGAATGIAVGATGGGVGAMVGTVLGEVLDPGYLLLRAILWAMAAAGIGGALGLLESGGARRSLDGAAFGLAGGAAGALLFSAAGPAELWQALAFAMVGAALGSGLHTPALRRAHAVLGTDGDERGRMTLLHIREWALEDGRAVALPGGAVLRCGSGRCQLTPGGAPVCVAGLPLQGPHDLRDGDAVELDGVRLRFRRLRETRAHFGTLALLVAMAVSPASAQPELVRCAEGRSVPCFRTRVELTPAAAQALSTGDSARWSGEAGAIPFREVDVRTMADAARPLVLLVLLDVSGSMAGEGMRQTRSALRAFLRGLGGSEVAVAPFGSRDVTADIRGARFGTPAEAEAGMDNLPAPAGNTGLYSAVATGAEMLAARLRTAPEGAQGVLLVLTDGRNDVGHHGDEPGLLAGPIGREQAVDAVRRSGVPVWMVGIGNGVDAGELAALAGPLGTPHTADFDPVRLRRTLDELRGSLASKREVTAVLPADARARLARGEVAVRVEHAVRSAPGPPHTARWRPPLMALPAFAGVASPSRPLATLAAMQDELADGGTLPVFAILATLLAGLWWIVPPLIWPVRRAAPATALPWQAPESEGIRAGVREAPPRRPSDVTAALARRIVVRSG